MPITLHLSAPLRSLAGGQATLTVEGKTVGAALTAAVVRFPGLGPALYDRAGTLRSELRVYLGDSEAHALEGADTPLPEGATLTVVAPQAAGLGG